MKSDVKKEVINRIFENKKITMIQIEKRDEQLKILENKTIFNPDIISIENDINYFSIMERRIDILQFEDCNFIQISYKNGDEYITRYYSFEIIQS